MAALFNNRKFLVSVIGFNLILIIALVLYVLDAFFGISMFSKKDEPTDDIVIEEQAELSDTYTYLVEDYQFELDDGSVFSFGLNGQYEGFFDSGNKNVTGYTYQFVKKDGIDYLEIYNEDKSRSVSYEFNLLEDGSGFLLCQPQTNTRILLTY